MQKKCKRCEQIKSKDDFSKSLGNKDGYSSFCKACVVLRNTEYWHTAIGRMSQIYSVQVMNSKQRKHSSPSYTRKDLTDWAFKNGLEQLWLSWSDSGYQKELIPSVDREDPNQGYFLTNIRLVTWKENNDKAYEDRKSCRHITKQNRKIEQLTIDGKHVAFFDSIAHASRSTGITRTNINSMCCNKPSIKSVGGFIWRHI